MVARYFYTAPINHLPSSHLQLHLQILLPISMMTGYPNNDSDSMTDLIDLVHLSGEKLQRINTALATILASNDAVEAFAQLVDGTPTRPSFLQNYGYIPENDSVSERENPTSEAIQFYKGAWPSFTALGLKISVRVGLSLSFSITFSCLLVPFYITWSSSD